MAIGACVAGVSTAEEGRWYLGASGGKASSNLSAEQFVGFVSAAYTDQGLDRQSFATTSVDDGDTAWSLFAGFRIFRYLAVEASYVDLGNTSFVFTGTVSRSDGRPLPPSSTVTTASVTGDLDASSNGFGLKAVGTLPLGAHFDLHAHAGIFRSTTEFNLVAPGSPIALWKFYRQVEDESDEPFYGIGLGYRFDDHWGLSIDWQRFADVGISSAAMAEAFNGPSVGEARADAEALTLGVKYSF